VNKNLKNYFLKSRPSCNTFIPALFNKRHELSLFFKTKPFFTATGNVHGVVNVRKQYIAPPQERSHFLPTFTEDLRCVLK